MNSGALYIYTHTYGETKLSPGSSTMDGAQTPGASWFATLINTVTIFWHAVTMVRITKIF
jgi:hypothetical protein